MTTGLSQDNAYIVVVLTQQHVLDDLQSSRRRNSRNHVVYTTNPDVAVREVGQHPVDIVITGRIFFRTDLPPNEQTGAYLENCDDEKSLRKHFRIRNEFPSCDVQVAEAVHNINDKVLVMRYAMLGDMKNVGQIFADIPRKPSDNRSLVDFLDCDDLCSMLSPRSRRKFMEKFPGFIYHRKNM